MSVLAEFTSALHRLAGQPCCFVGGPSAGTFINVDFGEEVLRPFPIDNPSLSERERRYQGAFCLFIECVWRIDSERTVLCGCWDDILYNLPRRRHFTDLAGTSVRDIAITEPALDLSIRFSNGSALRIFCDQVSDRDNPSNYSFFTPGKVYTVGCRSELRREERRIA